MRFLRCGLLIVLTLLVGSSIVSNGHAQDDGLTIGFLPLSSESEWRAALNENIIEEAEQRGIRLVVIGGNFAQSDSYIRGFRRLIEQRVDAILFMPVVPTGWDEVLQEAQDAGIPVVIVDRPIAADESLYLTRVGLDFVYQGRLAAAWLAQATSGTCQIVELVGIEGYQATQERQAGFEDVIALFPDMVIMTSQVGNFSRSGGKMAMETILATTDPAEICAVWAHNDDMALGSFDTLKKAGLDPGEDVLIVSIDAIPNMLVALADGETNATVEHSYHLAGPAFDALAAYFAGEVVPKWIPVQGRIFTQDTVTRGNWVE